MVSILQVGDIQKVLVIHKVALYCIFLSSLRGWNKGALLKYHNDRLYKMIRRTHVLYNSCL